jgi:PiT family inorganic phosphate transporter
VGAIVGFAAVGVSADAVAWAKVGGIVASWVVSPVLSGTMAFLLFLSAHKFILNTDSPFLNAKRYIPVYIFLTGFLIAMVTMVKGLKHVGLDLSYGQAALYAAILGLVIAILGKFLMRNVEEPKLEAGRRFDGVEKIFAVLMIFTASAMAFAHGSNDVANAIGPLAAVYSTIQSGGVIASKAGVPPWILLIGGIGIIIGLATYGYKVMATIGKRITELTPSRGFAAELGAAGTVVLASGTGLPVSTTHCLVGAVLGVGLARGIGALDLRVVGTIGVSWVVTLPAGAGLSILFFYILKGIFG